jgi:NAD(P)-dependent dehydrogenase (short-subunit alcohol dehydrogenase family)
MYRSRMWTQRQMFGYGAPEDTREGIGKALAAGLKGINIVVDPVSQQVIDPDHPAFGPEVGLDGASIPCKREELQLMPDGLGHAIVNLASVAGLTGFANSGAYCASKHATVALTKVAALRECSARHPRQCSLHGLHGYAAILHVWTDLGETWIATNAMSRVERHEEDVRLIAFLASDDADFVTGIAL